MAPELYPFRFRDPVTGKWVRARYRASLRDIAARYATWEVIGPASRPASPSSGFDPFRKLVPHAELAGLTESPPALALPADALEAVLVETFLRRYVTYCARRRRFAAMNGAAALLRALRAPGAHAPA